MRKVMMLMILMAITQCAANAQVAHHPAHPFERRAIHLGDFRTKIAIANEMQDTCWVNQEVCVWSVAGRIDYVGDINSVLTSGNEGIADSTGTADVFEMLSYATAATGLSLGYSRCETNCNKASIVRVLQAVCVKRTGSGSATRYSACGEPSYGHSEFSVCCDTSTGEPNFFLRSRHLNACNNGESIGCTSTLEFDKAKSR